MASVVIANPILNGPFAVPSRHFKFGDHGITVEIASGRRVSSYFILIAKPKKTPKGKVKQLVLDEDWVADRVEEYVFINPVRDRVKRWREGGYKHVTKTTARLMEHWNTSDRGCRVRIQIGALRQRTSRRRERSGLLSPATKGESVAGRGRKFQTRGSSCLFSRSVLSRVMRCWGWGAVHWVVGVGRVLVGSGSGRIPTSG